MKLEDLPPQLRDAANQMQKLGGDAYATARKKFLDGLAAHTGDLDKAQQSADELLEQAYHLQRRFRAGACEVRGASEEGSGEVGRARPKSQGQA